VNFSELAAKRLISIASSGARCGVYTLIHWDHRQTALQDFVPEELRKAAVCVSSKGNELILTGKPMPGTNLLLNAPPSPELATDFTHLVGRSSRDSSRVEVPFAQVAPAEGKLWSEERRASCACPSAAPGRRNCSTSPSAKARASMC